MREPITEAEEQALLKDMYARGVTPLRVCYAFLQAQEALSGYGGEEGEDSRLPAGIRVAFAAELGQELTQQIHHYFDWACAQFIGE